MKRMGLLVLLALLVLLIVFPVPSQLVSARAGGSTGGGRSGGSTSRGGSTSGTRTSTYYGGSRRSSSSSDDNSYAGFYALSLVSVGFASYSGLKFYRKKHYELSQPHNTLPIDTHFEKEFSDLFYQVEEAWSKTDMNMLAQMMTPHYFNKQKRIINRWRQFGKINRLDSLAIVDLQYEATSSNQKRHVVVTAQARDWFEYPHKSKAYNRAKEENAYIERFKEVWELVDSPTGWLLNNIRTVDLKN
ncbi:hypothetical protein R4Y45_06975 [Holzapfeliella sp. He02]|uniref:Tim44-like domain-containing protein n=1 Tax=Holzapfeliella saturejae TaxID=3082953 RepID=A0ABU8SIV2_9LACO